jgi:hypothetical protein
LSGPRGGRAGTLPGLTLPVDVTATVNVTANDVKMASSGQIIV